MRKYDSKRKQPKRWEERTKTWFAVLPVKIDGEVRWLQTVHVRQRYSPYLGWLNSWFEDAA